MDPTSGLIIGLSLVFSAVFSGTEIAFLSANRLRIELENKQGKFQARILSFFVKRPSRFIGAMLMGNNIMLVVYGIFMAAWLEPWIAEWWPNKVGILLTQTIISTIIILIFGEFLPKAIFQSNPNGILNTFSVPIFLIYWILWIPTLLVIGLSELLLRIATGKSYGKEDINFGRTDLDQFVRESTDKAAEKKEELEHEIQIFKNALEFRNLKARDCMVPRTEINALELESAVDELKTRFVETGFSKILIYRETIDNIIGYTHSYELFKQPDSIKSILLPISIVPETMNADEVLELLMKQKRAIAVVVDEFGGTAGIITIEDIIEQIFGEIEDEHDKEDLLENQINEKEFEFSGRHEIEYLNEAYDLSLPENEEYETLAGFVMFLTGDIPQTGAVIVHQGFHMTISQMSGNRIDTILIKLIDPDN